MYNKMNNTGKEENKNSIIKISNRIKKILNKKWEVEIFGKLSNIVHDFSLAEKVYFYSLCAIFIASGVKVLENVNTSLMVDVPANGGYINEGIVGSPRFINPVLAISDLDHDMSALIYSGLMKDGPSNSLTTDLAKSYDISSDGLTYTFILKDNIYFHDGVKVTADDVEFTINKIQDNTIKSPRRPAFYDVAVEKIDDKQIKFILKKPYSPFLENLTVGILPKHLWSNLSSDEFSLSQYNLEPIGSGPYKISKMETLQKNMLIIPSYYELSAFDKYASGRPFIDKVVINFYRDEKALIDAYNNGEIEDISSISPNEIAGIKKQSGAEVETSPLPRVFGVFFNQNQSEILSNKEVRLALDTATDKQTIVDDVLGGYGKTLDGPIPYGLISSDGSPSNEYNTDMAENILLKAGWIKNSGTGIMEKKISPSRTIKLAISISTLNSPDLIKAAELIKNDWEKIGATVDIKQFEFGDLQQNIIRPRKFEALLYGMVIGRDIDFFAFWHSSQRNDPGLNISMYANSKVDKLLEDARKTSNSSVRIDKYKSFENEIKKDIPAVFLYSPEFIYIIPDKIKGSSIGTITLPYERFLNINNWYIETNNLWKIFN